MSVPTLKQAPVQENTRIMGVGAYRPERDRDQRRRVPVDRLLR